MRILSGPVLAAACVSATGCAPDVDPPWLIRRPTELALRSEVVEQGPWGDRAPVDAPRTFHDALPKDRLRFTPFVVDEDGPIAAEDLSARWVMCQANGCLEALALADQLPRCDASTPYTELESCSPGPGSTIEYTLGPAPTDVDETSVFSLAAGPNVAYLASRAGAPGADACARALRDRNDLDGCVMMLRSVRIGPASTLLDVAAALGIEVEISDSLAPLLAVPRNRNPEVELFEVEGSSFSASATQTVQSGGSISTRQGDELLIRYMPSDEDFDNYAVELSGETLAVEEQLHGRWFLDRALTQFDEASTSVRLTVEGEPGPSNLYFVLEDGDGSEVWGSLTLDVSDR